MTTRLPVNSGDRHAIDVDMTDARLGQLKPLQRGLGLARVNLRAALLNIGGARAGSNRRIGLLNRAHSHFVVRRRLHWQRQQGRSVRSQAVGAAPPAAHIVD